MWLKLLLVFLTFVIAILAYRDFRLRREIRSLIGYAQKLSHGHYDLELERYSEHELSKLRDALYKTCVELNEAAKQNAETSKNLETALEDISHQLRTPLTSSQITLDNLLENPDLPLAMREKFLRTLARQNANLSELVVTLLSLAKFENGSLRLNPKFVSAKRLLETVKENLSVLAEIREVSVELDVPKNLKILIDEKFETQALQNLVKNAIEASSPGKKVLLTARENKVYTEIKIRDFGSGISKSDQKHLFERFYKTKNSDKESFGIGLAFAKTVVEHDGGTISVDSKLGVGSTFTIKFYRH